MYLINHYIYPWGLILQALALVHFIRQRPATWWLCVILILGPVGAAIYLCAEALPDIKNLSRSVKLFSRRKRIRTLEVSIRDNPSAANYEELGDLYFEDGKLTQAQAAFGHALAACPDPLARELLDTHYRRGLCAILTGDAQAALTDLLLVVSQDPDFDFRRAAGLLAHAYALLGHPVQAEAMFRHIVRTSTLSETYLNFADLLVAQGHTGEARLWAQKVIDKKATTPSYLRPRERPWLRSAKNLLKRLPAEPNPQPQPTT